jgi:hypothetical protein
MNWHYKDKQFPDMTVYEILKFNRELIEKLEAVGIRPGDCKYIDLYAEYVRDGAT